MFKFSSNGGGGDTNKSRKLAILLLSSFISLSPITTIIACNKKDSITDESSNIDKTGELFNTIKTKISDKLSNSEKSKIYLDAKDLDMKNEDVKKILNPIFKEAETQEVFVNNSEILDKITERVKNIVNNLNGELMKLPVLENSGSIITLNNLKAKMNGNDIKTLIDLIDKNQSAPTPDNNNFDYNLQLNLNFKININNKEDNYIYNPKSAFITSSKKDLDNKISNLADKLSEKLVNQDLNGKNIIDNVLNNKDKSYIESFSNELNKEFQDKSIIIKKSANMEINREQLSFQLRNITSDLSYGDKFFKFINEKSVDTTIEQMFNEKFKDAEFYQFKDYKNKIIDDKIYIKDYSRFLVTEWSIEGIELPERTLNNIKIYQEISKIKNSWRKFYKILKYCYEAIYTLTYNKAIIDYRYSSIQELKKETAQKRIQQWMHHTKNQIKDEKQDFLNAFTFKVLARDYEGQGWSNLYRDVRTYSIYIFNVDIKIFFSELCLKVADYEKIKYTYNLEIL